MQNDTLNNPKKNISEKPSVMERIKKIKKIPAIIISIFAIYWLYELFPTSDNKERIEWAISFPIDSFKDYNKEIEISNPIIIKRITKDSLSINNEHIGLDKNIQRDESQIFICSDEITNMNDFNIENIDGIPNNSKLIYTSEWSNHYIQVVNIDDWKQQRKIEITWQPNIWAIIIDKNWKNHVIMIGKLVNKIDERKINLEENLRNIRNNPNKTIDLSLWNKVNIVSAKLEINWNSVRIEHPYHLTPSTTTYYWKWIITIYTNNNQSIEKNTFYVDIPETREQDPNDNTQPESWIDNPKEENNHQDFIRWIIEKIEKINKSWIKYLTPKEYNQLISNIKLISTDNNESDKAQEQTVTTTHLNTSDIYTYLEKKHKNNPNNIYLITNSIWENFNIQSLNNLIKCSKLDNVILFLNFTDIEQVNILNEIQTSNINKNHIFITISDDLIWNLENYELKLPDWLLDWNFWQPIIWWDNFSNSLNWITVVEINPNKHQHKTDIEETVTPQ